MLEEPLRVQRAIRAGLPCRRFLGPNRDREAWWLSLLGRLPLPLLTVVMAHYRF